MSLPLLLLYPLVIIGLFATILIFIITPSKDDPINIGLIDHDQSKETQMVMELIETTSQFGDTINILPMNEEKAISKMKNNQLSSYIIFPKEFTNDLYTGHSVDLEITGNPNQPIKSQLVKELIDSITRHISASQANILTINYYASELNIDQKTRQNIVFEQFKEFLIYTLGKDNILNEKSIDNTVTETPVHYYGLASWFIINTVWLLLFYSFFHQEETTRLKHRIMLYGVTRLQQTIAKIIVSVIVCSLLMTLSLVGLHYIIQTDYIWQDYMHILTIMFIYCFTFLLSMALIEIIIPSQKLGLIIQISFTGGLLLISGAIIPTIYLPAYVQNFAHYSFSFQAFNSLKEIFLQNRILVDYIPHVLSALSLFFVLVSLTLWKERNK